MAISDRHELAYPPMKVQLEPSFPGTLEGAPRNFRWPAVQTPQGIVDLRKVPPPSEKKLRFLYRYDLSEGWCGLSNMHSGLACGVAFDQKVFRSCWLFGSFGGWRNFHVAVLEPSTGIPYEIARAVRDGTCAQFAPGEEMPDESSVFGRGKHFQHSIDHGGRRNHRMLKRGLIPLLLLAVLIVLPRGAAQPGRPQVPKQVPSRRSTQLVDGFGMNISLPREPALPWTRRWWSRMFDSGVKWLRIGQYENSSERTSWDWVEQTPGHWAVTEDLDEAIRSLADNGVSIEIQLQYANPLYDGHGATRPQHVILPPPGISPGDHPPNPIFIPPTTDEQMDAFLKYVRFMVNRYKGVVKHWELWNEPNIDYWQPHAENKEQLVEKARAYGRLLTRFVDAVHEEDTEAKVISGGTASPDLLFVRTALATAAPKVDIVAYHTYPGFGSNHMPEEMDSLLHAAYFREQIIHVPGIRPNVEFWDNEWNVSPLWKNSNESVQARYVPRFYLYNLAQHVRGAMWTFIPGTDGNEDDLYGILHGETHKPDAFQPREAYRSFSVVSALLGQTTLDPMAEFSLEGVPARYQHGQLQAHAFQDQQTHKLIYAVWLALLSEPADKFVSIPVDLKVPADGLPNPVLIDVRTGSVAALRWKRPGVLSIPLKDSVVAVADASYLDWAVVPEAPAELRATREGREVKLAWKTYGQSVGVEVQRSVAYGPWEKLATLEPGATQYSDAQPPAGHMTYRVRAEGKNGPSAWSNPAWVDGKAGTASK